MGGEPSGTGPLSPDFVGIDPTLMSRFITEMEHARGVVGERTEAVRRVFAANGVSAASLDPIGEAERWIDDKLPELRTRHRLTTSISSLPAWDPTAPGRLVPYEEKSILPVAEARRLGAELALKYSNASRIVPAGDKSYQEIVDALTAHVHDSEFAAAFFAGLGLRQTLELPQVLLRALVERHKAAIDVISQAFGTAVSAGDTTGDFAAIRNAMRHRLATSERQGLGDLLSAGSFPTEWLADVVAAQVLGSEDLAVGTSPRRFETADATMGLSLAPYLNALARDPSAARLAISAVTHGSPRARNRLSEMLLPNPALADGRPDLVTILGNLDGRAALDPTASDAFGRLLASASGAYDESDGRHSDAAARFTFNLIIAAGAIEFAPPARVHLAEIAGSYATEMTEGANLGDDNQFLPSAFEPVASRLPGLRPMFRLSPEHTYKFIRTFADTSDHRLPFDTGMGNLTRRVLDVGVPTMLESEDPKRLDATFSALGNIRGMELGAAAEHAEAMDEIAEREKDGQDWALGVAFGLAGFVIPGGMTGAALWTALTTGYDTYDTFKPNPETNTDKLSKITLQEDFGRRRVIAQLLMDAGATPKVSPRDYQALNPSATAIADADGRLIPFPEISKSTAGNLFTVDEWLIANGMGKDQFSLGESVRMLSDTFGGSRIAGGNWRALSQ
ncbi:hypothetical protein Pth03_29900 [Planotetraspora thailandica]|uniref:Uncharacterized protein n=1 Tax=Planotetraspora thailandica TaxID=487172 RepID=A0A8J3V409_9ACTN|nr:hypothetical protein [Planotetraspora thailandica]GII54601.1 hypothetical protein Pth03_29900 [Planotetraspora thailandica]